MAKLLVWGEDRNEAIVRGARALEMFRVEGVKTSIRSTSRSSARRTSGPGA